MPAALTRRDRLALIVIFLIGTALRFQQLDAIEYNVDQVYPIWQAIQTLDAGEFPLAGQGTSVLFANPPLTGYFFVPVIGLVRQPIAAYAVTLILNTFAIWLAYRAIRWLIGTRPALIAALLFAVNPWLIEDSRRTWVQSLAPFFVCLVFWALAPVLTGQTRHPQRRLLIALVGLALFAHTYLLAFALIAPVGLLIALHWRRIPKRALLTGLGFFALLLVLYGIGLAQQWENTTNRTEDFASDEAHLSAEALNHALRLVTGNGYAIERGTHAPIDDADTRDTLTLILHSIWLGALIVGIGKALALTFPPFQANVRLNSTRPLWSDSPPLPEGEGVQGVRASARTQPQTTALILLIWFLLPVAMMSYVSRDVHPFYLHLTLPAGHALAAWGIVSGFNTLRNTNLKRAWATGTALLLSGTVIINSLNVQRFAQETAAHPGNDLPVTLPLSAAHALGAQLRDQLTPGMAVFSRMDDWTPVTLVGENIRSANTVTYGRAAIVPPQGGLYIQFQRPADPALPLPPFAQPAGDTLRLVDGTLITLWRVTPADVRIDHPLDIPTDIGLRLVGWTLQTPLMPGDSTVLYTIWRVDGLQPDRGIWSFLPVVKVFDPAGTLITSDQGHAVAALTWRIGDLIVQRLDLTLPADAQGPFTLELSLFDPVRVRDDGTTGINAVFQLPVDDEIRYTPIIALTP